MIPTLRRLNDRERYWGLAWPGWLAAGLASAGLYGAVKVSPFGPRVTITIVVLGLAFGAVVMAGVSGQALSPGRQLLAIARYRRSPKHYILSDRLGQPGLVLDVVPPPPSESSPAELEVESAREAALVAEEL